MFIHGESNKTQTNTSNHRNCVKKKRDDRTIVNQSCSVLIACLITSCNPTTEKKILIIVTPWPWISLKGVSLQCPPPPCWS